jgi:hypothetical protein
MIHGSPKTMPAPFEEARLGTSAGQQTRVMIVAVRPSAERIRRTPGVERASRCNYRKRQMIGRLLPLMAIVPRRSLNTLTKSIDIW